MDKSNHLIRPTSAAERIISLDVLRGIAVLGILIMNIQSFSMISAAYLNPTAYGDLTGINKWVWIISNILANGKFVSIFSILFGAGVILFTNRVSEKGMNAAAFYYKRTFWLLIFGLIHSYLIWYGDILTTYALCGSLVFLFRKLRPKNLMIIASVFFIIPILLSIMAGLSIPTWPPEQYAESIKGWIPTAEIIQQEVSAYQGNWIDQSPVRTEMAIFMQTFLFFWSTLWRVVAMMLLGMALFKLGILSANKSVNFYWRMTFIGLVAGISLSSIGVYQNFNANWHYDYSMFFGNQFNYVGSVFTALGFIGIVMLICKSSGFKHFKYMLSSVGKMAFTNYILMSLLAMFIFYGTGFGLFGQVERWLQAIFVLVIWIIILLVSQLWLRKFYFGPLEWLWRILTYWKIQPFKKTNNFV